ncbi:ATP-binding protein [Kitasatospora sp. NPDC101801]|uniref:ATP-binding protein n=1 Tax=Kitasatospora sp. NPDC101801 TaxID=3364103 RepID=UPI003804FE9E
MSALRETLNGRPPGLPPTLPSTGQRRRLVLTDRRRPVAASRAFARVALDDRSCPGTGDVELVVTELVANAMLHADGPLDLVLDITAERFRIEVNDSSPVLPAAREPHVPTRPGGHGLVIVGLASDRWGTAPRPWGKTVWAEIDIRRSAES